MAICHEAMHLGHSLTFEARFTNDRIEKDTKGILCIFVKDDDDNNNYKDGSSSCYALKPRVESELDVVSG